MQTCKKSLPSILRSKCDGREKLEAWYHLTGNISYLLMVLLSLVLVPAMIVRFHQGWFELVTIDLPLFMLSFTSVSTFYIVSQKALHRDWYRRILYLPGLMAVGIGMMIPGAKSVLEGALGVQTPFVRTPKFSVQGSAGEWKSKRYRTKIDFSTAVEIIFGVYFTAVVFYAWRMGIYGVIPFLILFQAGLSSFAQEIKRFRPVSQFLLFRPFGKARLSRPLDQEPDARIFAD
jgi:hypothetical protein